MRQPWSLQTRSLAAAIIALAAFLGLAFFALNRAYYDAAENALRDRLQSYALAYMAGSDPMRSGEVIPPEVGPDPRFDQSTRTGLYASMVGTKVRDGSKGQWRSPSARNRDLPFAAQLEPGQVEFVGPVATAEGSLFVFSQGTAWIMANGDEVKITFYVAEDVAGLEAMVDVYRNTLLAWFLGLGVVLLLLLLVLQRWTLSPLRKMEQELIRVKQGRQERMSGHYPGEVAGITESFNGFIDGERERLGRYRNTLSDLAHSLKTPLAVMRSQLESRVSDSQLHKTMLTQSGRMEDIVAYQLSRAAACGHQAFAAPIPVADTADELVTSLEKVYASKGVLCEFDLEEDATFLGEKGDLMELLGNLLENSFKWARRRVLLSVHHCDLGSDGQRGLCLIVEDDGSGIEEDRVEHVLQRGVRGDERVQGHGIGLSIVQDILKGYRGELIVGRSETLGGARFEARVGTRV